MFGGVGHGLACEWEKSHHRNIFHGWRMLRAKDFCEGGTVNSSGISIIRSVEKLKAYERGVMGHGTTIQKYAAILEEESSLYVPMEINKRENGKEIIMWDVESQLCFLLKHYGLEDKEARQSISISAALDGASLSTNLHYVALGFKMCDDDTLSTLYNQPMFFDNQLIPSNHHIIGTCFYTILALGRETKGF